MNRGLTPPVIVIHPDPRDLQRNRRSPILAQEKKHKNNTLFLEPSTPVEKDSTFDTEDKKKNQKSAASNRPFVLFACGLCRCFRNKKNEKIIEEETGPGTKYQF
ncbi:unnamed protein product [Blepharisma stoltei]|uniref:Uncharacterized protein n=1 Tax=Blepharisma stoltei TaxID=1481888 RepID=A0AAU9KFF9_9CILI|nr:unnamed protein product [Blepharisma stoltei]